MLKRVLSVLTMAALACATSVVNASAQDAGTRKIEAAPTAAVLEPAETPESGAGAGLKAGLLKLVAEARAGGARQQQPPPRRRPAQSNGLSKGQKVAIGVGTAAAVILVIILSRRGGSDSFNAPPCPPGQLCQ